MKDKKTEIEVDGVKYGLVFNLNSMQEIQEKYETLSKWSELLESRDGEPDIKALKFGISAMMNEAIDIENETNEIKRPFLTDKQIGRIITAVGMEEMFKKAKETVIVSTDNEPKNV